MMTIEQLRSEAGEYKWQEGELESMYQLLCDKENGLIKERWVDIPNFKGYQVSDWGSMRSFKRSNVSSPMKPDITDRGYYRTTTCAFGQIKKHFIHKLVCELFNETVDGKTQINHIIPIKWYNYYRNLEFCTQGENNSHAYRTGIHKGSGFGKKDELSGVIRPIIQYTKNGEFVNTYISLTAAMNATGVDVRRIGENASGKKHGGGGFNWKYCE